MAANFPDSPTVGAIYTIGTKQFTWTGTVWRFAANVAVPGGTSGQLQYNNGTGLSGATNVSVDGGDLTLASNPSPSAPSAGNVKLVGKLVGGSGGRMMPAALGPSGLSAIMQPAMFRQNVALWKPPGNSTTVPGVFGFNAPTAGGTATARNVATTNALTRARRLAYVSAATAGSYGGHYATSAQYTVGDGTGLGGFLYSCRFGASDAVFNNQARTFVGLSSSVAAPTNVDPIALANCIGIGNSAADSNWRICYGGNSAQTSVDLGTDFPINTTDLIELTLWSPSNQNGVVYYEVTRFTSTGQFVATGMFGPGTAGLTLPANTTLLAHRAWRNNNTVAAAVGLDISSVYIETDW